MKKHIRIFVNMTLQSRLVYFGDDEFLMGAGMSGVVTDLYAFQAGFKVTIYSKEIDHRVQINSGSGGQN